MNSFRIAVDTNRPTAKMLEELKYEILANLDTYSPFMTENSDIVAEIDAYVDHGNYSNAVCDLIVHALANMYRTKIVVHVVGGGTIVATPNDNVVLDEAHLRKVGEHYDALLPKDAPVVLSSSDDEVDAADDVMIRDYFAEQNEEEPGNAVGTETPVFRKSPEPFGLKDIHDILVLENFPTAKVCEAVPTGVKETVAFIIDTTKIGSHKDLTADDLGKWGKHMCPSSYIKVVNGQVKSAAKGDSDYVVKRHYADHESGALKRTIYRVFNTRDSPPNLLRYAMTQYRLVGDPSCILAPTPHGNSKSSKPYYRTKPSVLDEAREAASSKRPKKVVFDVNKRHASSTSVGDTLKNRQQVYDLKKNGQDLPRFGGNTKTMDMKQLDNIIRLHAQNDFVKRLCFNDPCGPLVFLINDRQIHEIKKYCCGVTGPDISSIFCVDPTYNLGDFYATVSVYEHPMLVVKDTTRHPTIIGPVMLHSKRREEDYKYFGSCMESLKVHDVKVWGSDGERALEQGLAQTMKGEHLRCMKHAWEDMSRKLALLNVPKERAELILASIFGVESGGTRKLGLVDCDTVEEFDMYIENLLDVWNVPGLGEYLEGRNHAGNRSWLDIMKECMLSPLRTFAGLGNPPNQFTTQRNESVNNVLKAAVGRQKQDMMGVIKSIQEEVEMQTTEITRALSGIGEYRLDARYQHLEIDGLRWCQMNGVQRDAHMKRVFGVPKAGDDPSSANADRLSVPHTDLSCDSVPLAQVAIIWRKASSLIADAEGKQWLVHVSPSQMCIVTPKQPISVSVPLSGKAVCAIKCQNYTAFGGVCEHCLVGAEFLGRLRQYVAYQNGRKSTKGSNIYKPSTGAGKKGGKPRQGVNNSKQCPIVTVRDPFMSFSSDIDKPKPRHYTEHYHNDNPFYIVFLKDFKYAKKCIGCSEIFPRVQMHMPFDIVIAHEERFLYPDENGEWVPSHRNTRNGYYCIKKDCILRRHPHFWKGLLQTEMTVKERLTPGHKNFLMAMLNYAV